MMQTLRRYLVAGLLIWVPLGVTILIIKFLVDTMDQLLVLLPAHLQPDALLGFHIPGLGIVLAAIVVVGTGMIVANLFGKQLLKFGEAMVERIPLVRTIYGSVKKLTETLFSGSGKSFRKVVLVEYPRKGMWSFAFLTGEGGAEIERKLGRQTVNVFIPTTPNPTSGFVLVVPREDIVELSMSVDEGLKLILSIGVVVPDEDRHVLVGSKSDAA